MAKRFKYVVARPWYPDEEDSSLAIYSFHTEVQTGTMEDAEAFLAYVRRQKDDPGMEKHWGIYKVKYKKV